MKWGILLSGLLIAQLGTAGEQLDLDFGHGHCVTLDQAQSALTQYLGANPAATVSDDFPFVSDEDLEGLEALNPSLLTARIVNGMFFKAQSDLYMTKSVVTGYCAPAAECWGYYVVNCQGQVEARLDGED